MTYTQMTPYEPTSPMLQALAEIPLTPEQQRMVVAFAATVANMPSSGLAFPSPSTPALPGTTEVLGIPHQELQPLVDEFLANQRARGRTEGTLRSYRLALGRLVKICPLLPVTAAHVREAITRPDRVERTEPLSQNTVRLRFALTRCFLAEMEDKRHLTSPCWEIGRVAGGDFDARILSRDEVKAVYAAAMAGAPHRKHRGLAERNGLMILFMMECGPRASDIAMMRAQDVSDGWVQLRAKTAPDWVPVPREITDALKAQIQGEVVWPDMDGKPLQYQGVDYVVGSALARAGIRGDRLGVHTMRHSFATHYLREGGGVFQLQRILRHSNLAMTRRYVRLSGVDVKLDHERVSLTRAMGLIG